MYVLILPNKYQSINQSIMDINIGLQESRVNEYPTLCDYALVNNRAFPLVVTMMNKL